MAWDDDVRFTITTVTASASTGNQDITVTGFGTPKVAMFIFYVPGTDEDTFVSHRRTSIGAATSSDVGDQWAFGEMNEDSLASSDTGHVSNEGKVVYAVNINRAVFAQASFVSFITDGVRINWTQASAQKLTVLMWGGTEVNATVSAGSTPSSAGGTTTYTTGHKNTLLFLYSQGETTWRSAGTANTCNDWMCWASSDGYVSNFGCGDIDNAANGDPRGGYSDTHFWYMYTPFGQFKYLIDNFTSTSFDLTDAGADQNANWFGYVSIDLGGWSSFGEGGVDTPTSTGDWERSGFGFAPQFIVGLQMGEGTVAGENTESLHASDLDGVSCRTILAAGKENDVAFSHFHHYEDNSASMNVNTIYSTAKPLRSWDDTGSTKLCEGSVSAWGSDGITFNLTTAGQATWLNYIAFGDTPSTGGGGGVGGLVQRRRRR